MCNFFFKFHNYVIDTRRRFNVYKKLYRRLIDLKQRRASAGKETRTTAMTFFGIFILTLNRSYTPSWCFHCWLWINVLMCWRDRYPSTAQFQPVTKDGSNVLLKKLWETKFKTMFRNSWFLLQRRILFAKISILDALLGSEYASGNGFFEHSSLK